MKEIISEEQFENRIRNILSGDVFPSNSNFMVFDNKKGSDILICKNGENPDLFFIEVKYYNKSHGRLGFGHQKGAGFQPELMRKRPSFFETNLRWILGSINDDFYYFLSSDEISKYISGNGIDFKQNNFQTKLFQDVKGLTKSELVAGLKIWMLV